MGRPSDIRVERDPAFWGALLTHPDVQHVMRGIDPSASLLAILGNETVIPLASENGGYLFVQMDPFGRVYDLHAAYTRDGWGREANGALKAALDYVNADIVLVFETELEGTSPPLSFGFKAAAQAQETPLGVLRTWVLTREAWEASKARARMH